MGYDMSFADNDGRGGHADAYFQLNISGMSRCCDLMDARGLLCNPGHPRFPDYPLNDSHRAEEWLLFPQDRRGREPSTKDLAEAQRYLDACDGVLRAHPGTCPGIPVHKFGTNSGWIITPDECQTALALLDQARHRGLADPDDHWWPTWIDYLRRAIDHGGIAVW